MQHYYVGQPIVCIDAESHNRYVLAGFNVERNNLDGLTEGTVYHIRDILTEWFAASSKLLFRLEEIVRGDDYNNRGEVPFASERFRPVVETKIDDLKALAIDPKDPDAFENHPFYFEDVD